MVWDNRDQKCLARHSGALPQPELTEFAFALAKATSDEKAALF
jgi:hypothetical protein